MYHRTATEAWFNLPIQMFSPMFWPMQCTAEQWGKDKIRYIRSIVYTVKWCSFNGIRKVLFAFSRLAGYITFGTSVRPSAWHIQLSTWLLHASRFGAHAHCSRTFDKSMIGDRKVIGFGNIYRERGIRDGLLAYNLFKFHEAIKVISNLVILILKARDCHIVIKGLQFETTTHLGVYP